MTTPESLCAADGIDLVYFDGRDTDSKAMFNKKHKLIAIDAYLDDTEKKKRIYHELGHQDHELAYYQLNREKCELQADRNMIHYLLKEELELLDDVSQFNYVHFMDKYELDTLADETMIKEEFYNLLDEV